MKRLICILLIAATLFCLTSCGKQKQDEPVVPVPGEQQQDDGPKEEFWGENGPITAETVTITLPEKIAGSVDSGNLNNFIDYYGYDSAVINSDGSVTVTMGRERWYTIMALIRMQTEDELGKLAGSAEYPEISSASVNEEYTVYTVYTDKEKVGDPELRLCDALAGYAYYYHVFFGLPDTDFVIRFCRTGSTVPFFTFSRSDWENE